MESITLGQISLAVALIVGLVTGIAYLNKHINEWIVNSLKPEFEEIKDEIKEIREQLKDTDIESTKNFLVSFLSDVEKGDKINDVVLQRFWEEYQHYQNRGGNSYIKEKVEKLKAKGYL